MRAETPEDRTRARARFRVALATFVQSAHALLLAWEGLHLDDEDVPAEDYPFPRSFDDLLVAMHAWRERVDDRLPTE